MIENLFGTVTILAIILIAALFGWKRQRELYKKFEEEEGLTFDENEDAPMVEDDNVETVSESEETIEGEATSEETKKYTPKRRTRKPYKKSTKHKND